MTEFKPCPFCGSDVEYLHQISSHQFWCRNRECLSVTRFPIELTEDEAIRKWNTRSYDKDLIDIGVYAENIIHRIDVIRGKKKR